MKLRRRFRSLFWTLAAAFLAVLIAAIALQGWVTMIVLDRIVLEVAEDRAKIILQKVGETLNDLPGQLEHTDIRSTLSRHRSEDKSIVLLFKHSSGGLIPDRRITGHSAHRLQSTFGDTFLPLPHPPPPHRSNRPPPGREHRPPASNNPPPRPPPSDRGDIENQIPEIKLLARQPVHRDVDQLGELIAVYLQYPVPIWWLATSYQALLFVPIALLVAGFAGLILFRLLLKRLRQLEHFAAQLTEGDLDARILNPGADEIGRLGHRLNRMAEALLEAKIQVHKSEQQRRRLLADISHELGTPLTSIRGYTETLLNPEVPKSTTEHALYLEHVLDEAKRMDGLLQDLYELTRLEAGPHSLQLESLDWSALCLHTLQRFQPRFCKAGLKLCWQGEKNPAWIVADGRRLEQVIDNLLINALRYVPDGGQVILSLQPCRKRPSYFQLCVLDNGLGIPEEALTHIFDRFYRADTARNIQGSGLGLAIVKEIVLKHGGHIYAENRKPHGISIFIELPAETAPLS